jgi:hypothetical protein
MFTRIVRASLLLMVATAGFANAQAQESPRSNTVGLNLGVSLNGSAQRDDGYDSIETGGGFGLRIGYGFNPAVTLYFGVDGAWMPEYEYGFGHGDLGLRLNFGGPTRNLIPYLDGAVSSRAMVDDYYEVTGYGASVGGGLQVFLSAPLALDLGLKWTYGRYTTLKDRESGVSVSGDGYNALSSRFNAGLSWYPSVPR